MTRKVMSRLWEGREGGSTQREREESKGAL